MNRYDRQIRLPEIGREGQDKLLKASVLCVGAGGLGSPALLYLVAAGVGQIGIIDFDRVDESNLQRQILFDTEAVGKPKALEAARRLKALNPTIHIQSYDEELNAENAARLFPQYDIIVDATDNFETKYLINDAAVKFGKPWIYGAIQGFDGQASVFNYKSGPCYRCLYPEKPKGRIMNCAEGGVIGAVAGLIGVTQALQAIQIITGHESFEPLSGRLMTLDTRTMTTRILALKKNPDCPACGKNRNEIALSYSSPVCGFVPEISVVQMKERAGYILIDVREREEWEQGHIEGARLWPLSTLMQGRFPEIPKDSDIILHCQKGLRSLQAAQIFKDNGFMDVASLSGGYEAWLEEN
jgi:molybdopterin/thiamine biosynthesis adenylyltransferase/rhodanese-related sulfurtransferase